MRRESSPNTRRAHLQTLLLTDAFCWVAACSPVSLLQSAAARYPEDLKVVASSSELLHLDAKKRLTLEELLNRPLFKATPC